MDSTHFLFRQGKLYPYWYNCMSYLYKCGVLGVICLLPGSTTTFYKPSEISSTLSFLLTTSSGVGPVHYFYFYGRKEFID